MGTINISLQSRYKDTPAYANDGQPVFGPLLGPEDFEAATDNTTIHRVTRNEVGMLDKLAVRYFGVGSEHLWWIIAYLNALIDPERDMYPGQELMIPGREELARFLARPGNAE